MKTIKIEIEETSRTDLLCVRCGGFRTEFAVRESDHVGVHKRCLREARPQSAVRSARPVSVDPVKIDFDDEGEIRASVEGPVTKGPALRPKRVRSMKQFTETFGEVTSPVDRTWAAGSLAPIPDESPLDREERELRHALDLAAD